MPPVCICTADRVPTCISCLGLLNTAAAHVQQAHNPPENVLQTCPCTSNGSVVRLRAGLVIERSRVRVPAGAAEEFVSTGSKQQLSVLTLIKFRYPFHRPESPPTAATRFKERRTLPLHLNRASREPLKSGQAVRRECRDVSDVRLTS